ncbi:hypothetical protein EPI10_001749 [Gossypium australe]|uniref:Uncharacterized protein n=1 Tax=Gossypium australe TaxID=47621 RepID=A0A5B6VBZ1_9ROSI|nr:hypothetical protein EPI10_001749 [Gossypium australe]
MQLGHISEKGMTTLCKQGALENVKIGVLSLSFFPQSLEHKKVRKLTNSSIALHLDFTSHNISSMQSSLDPLLLRRRHRRQ